MNDAAASLASDRGWNCPSCDRPPFERRALEGIELRLRRCSSCRLVYLEGWHDGFQVDLYDYYGDRLGWSRELVHRPVNEPRLHELAATLEDETRGRRLLDVGCGAGHWVSVASQRGWEAYGIDLSESAVRLANRLGAHAKVVDFFDPTLEGGCFDAITMWEFIEHVTRPDRFFARAAELLAPGGVLAMSTPNFGALGRRWLGEAWPACGRQHLVYFEVETMRACLGRHFGRVDLTTRGLVLPTPRRRHAPAEGHHLQRAAIQSTRERLVRSPGLSVVKRILDRMVARTPVGETLYVVASEPRRS